MTNKVQKQVLRFAQDDKRKKLLKLFQKSYIALKEQLNVIYSVFQNCDAFYAHAEGEAGNFCRVVIYKAEDVGVDHAAAEEFDPSAGLAVAAGSAVADAFAIAEDATDLHVGAWLGEREERRIE